MVGDQYQKDFPDQQQSSQPGIQEDMDTKPESEGLESENGLETYKASGKLEGKIAVISGGDSGIGRSVSVLMAKEGADVAIIYKNEEEKDAQTVLKKIKSEGRKCLLCPTEDIGIEENCRKLVNKIVEEFGRIDILVNNAGEQHLLDKIEDLTGEQLERTFRTNIFGMFYMTKHSLPHMKQGSSIINSSSVTAFKGHKQLLDYSATKGAISSFTRSLALQLAERGIRVNAVAEGPVWTPLITSTFPKEKIESHGKNVPLERAAQPAEIGPSYVFLASSDSSYFTGQHLHPNGGTIVG